MRLCSAQHSLVYAQAHALTITVIHLRVGDNRGDAIFPVPTHDLLGLVHTADARHAPPAGLYFVCAECKVGFRPSCADHQDVTGLQMDVGLLGALLQHFERDRRGVIEK